MRLLGITVAVLLLAGHGNPKLISCWTVLPYVWAYGEDAAIAWAKSRGYTDRQIAEMRKRCSKV